MSENFYIAILICVTLIVISIIWFGSGELVKILKYKENKRREEQYLLHFGPDTGNIDKHKSDGIGSFKQFITNTSNPINNA